MRTVRSHRWLASVALLVLLPLLAACGGTASEGDQAAGRLGTSSPVAEVRATQPSTTATAAPDVAARTSAIATPEATTAAFGDGSGGAMPPAGARLSDEELQAYQPNELGYIPVLQYHLFTTDPDNEDELTRPIKDFRADLEWLYEHDFYVIPMADFVRNQISAPPGKHPVVLSFDDATPSQFRFIRNKEKKLVPDPESAVGVMEAFYAEHPDFGRGGFFALLPFNCFGGDIEPKQAKYCDEKLTWLIDHGYEVGNHTMGHTDLLDVSDEQFKEELGGSILWLDEHAPGHTGTIIPMPYGNYPDKDLHPEQHEMLRNGFTYKGRKIEMEVALMVGAEPSVSPSSTLWDPIWIPRIQAFDASLDLWFSKMTNGEVILYTSDGNPQTVTVPKSLPRLLKAEFDADHIAASGKELVRYKPD